MTMSVLTLFSGVLLAIFLNDIESCEAFQSQVTSKLSLQIHYSNPYNYARDGKCDYMFHDLNCDVYFQICIWNGEHFEPHNCDVALKRTSVYQEQKYVSLYDEEKISIPIKGTIPPRIRMRIEIMDYDKMTNDDHIATYISDALEVSSQRPLERVHLRKTDHTTYTKDVKLTVYAKYECVMNYYGTLCDVHCNPNGLSYTCASNGSRICFPGYRGGLCDKADYCFIEPCPPHAVCSNLADGTGRICVCNGGQGDECYTMKDVCVPSPCANDGKCVKSGPHLQEFFCECHNYWHGPTCSELYSSCEAAKREILFNSDALQNGDSEGEPAVCKNGGRCVDSETEFRHTCVCSPGWKGETCEHRNWTTEITTSFFVILLLLLIIGILIYYFMKKYKRLPKSTKTTGNEVSNIYSANLIDDAYMESYIYPMDSSRTTKSSPKISEQLLKMLTKTTHSAIADANVSDASRFNDIYGEISPSYDEHEGKSHVATLNNVENYEVLTSEKQESENFDVAPPLPIRHQKVKC